MSGSLEGRLKTALDESRLLILGAQVLFGFQFQAVFQELFETVPGDSQALHCAGLAFMLLATGCLIAPSLYHQMIYRGDSRRGALSSATAMAGASLFPLALGLGCSVFVVFDRLFGRTAGAVLAVGFSAIALGLWYGLGLLLKRGVRKMPPEESTTPLKTKIEQMLTEARVIIPGGQALLGFQFVATLTKTFGELPATVQHIHAAGLCAVALAVLLLMTPAALHRIAFHGEDDKAFFRIGSRLVVAATLPLAIGISADVFVVYYKVSGNMSLSGIAGIVAFCLLTGIWYGYPLWRSIEKPAALRRSAPESRHG
jgi:hypothetical protein